MILTLPVIDILKRDFPSAKLSVVISPKARSLFYENPNYEKIYVFDKHQSPFKTVPWIFHLRRQHFDLVVDLRNTAIPFMISARYRSSCRVDKTSNRHMREKHLNQLRSVYNFQTEASDPKALFITKKDKKYVGELMGAAIKAGQKYVVIAPGAADSSKRWNEESFAFVCDRLAKGHNLKIVFVGDEEDRKVAQRIGQLMGTDALDVCGRTSLIQLAELFKYCFFTIVNDSAPMHLASYLNVPVLALFGPSDPQKYGPWGSRSHVIKKEFDCPVCRDPKSPMKHTCINTISKDTVLEAAEQFIRQKENVPLE